jgi:polysaccharide export outer membrane protein
LLLIVAAGCSSARPDNPNIGYPSAAYPPPAVYPSMPAPAPASTAAAMPSNVVRPSAAAGLGGAYRLGIGDKILISVHGEPDLTLDYTLSESGTVNYPFLGDIPAVGLTVDQLQRRVDSGLRGPYLVNPDVRVIVTAYRNFYINGEVRTPSGYGYVPGLTVRQAAALAGGFTERASMGKITVFREASPTRPDSANLDTPVFPGDTVVVGQGLF